MSILILLDPWLWTPSLLLTRLSSPGITFTLLCWFHSNLQDHTQFLKLKSFASGPSPDSNGVPQGSMLGPSSSSPTTSLLNLCLKGVSNEMYHCHFEISSFFIVCTRIAHFIWWHWVRIHECVCPSHTESPICLSSSELLRSWCPFCFLFSFML